MSLQPPQKDMEKLAIDKGTTKIPTVEQIMRINGYNFQLYNITTTNHHPTLIYISAHW